MTAQPPDSPPETPQPGQTSRSSEAQRTYDRLSRSTYDLTVVEARRSSILGLPVAIVM